jgi:hypothetical protein
MCLLWQDSGTSGGECIVSPTVFAVGFDDKHVVVKSHPRENPTVTAYWYIVRDRHLEDRAKDPRPGNVNGPYSEAQYASLSAKLHLPPFTTVFEDLQ